MAAVTGLWKVHFIVFFLWSAFVSPISLSVTPLRCVLSCNDALPRVGAFVNTRRVPSVNPYEGTGETLLPSSLWGAGVRRRGPPMRFWIPRNLFHLAAGWKVRLAARHATAAAAAPMGEYAEELHWGRWSGVNGPDLPVSCMHSGHWARDDTVAAFRGFSSPRYIPTGPRRPGSSPGSLLLPPGERSGFGASLTPCFRPISSSRRLYNAQDGYLPPAEAQQFPRNMEAFQEAMSKLDSKFLQFAKETASPTAKNQEILQSLSMLWRQRHLEQRQEEAQQQCLDSPATSPLFNAGDESVLTRKRGSAFRARAYKTAYEILGSSRIPIHNIAEVLLLLREGGLVLRGEEKNVVQRGTFRSAVLQKILVVLCHGVAELIRKSRNSMREAGIHDLTRLPGVSRRTAAILFDDYLIDNAQVLRDRIAALQPAVPLTSAAACPGAPVKQWAEHPEALRQQDKKDGLLKLFPTALSRACIMHADSFGATMDATEFDEWQQQLLLVQQRLREVAALSPFLPLDIPKTPEGLEWPKSRPEGFRTLPVLSLGGGIFHGSNRKLTSLSLQVSLLPSWAEEEGLLPPTLERAVCTGGEGTGPRELSWVQQQWERVSKAFTRLRMQLHRSVVEALQQLHLLSEVFCENSRTKTTHAAGRLPWHQESYRLITIQTVPPRAFPFATLAARCCASAYRRLQQKTQQQWGCSLTPSGFSLGAARPPATNSSSPDMPASVSLARAAAASSGDTPVQNQGNELNKTSPALVPRVLPEQAWWVLDEQGVLRLLQEPLSMQERVGDLGACT